MTAKTQAIWTFVIVSLALFMTTLDNLVVTTALPTIQRDLNASVSQLEWTVNAYTLTFAVLLMTGAALGDRFGRKRLFLIGMVIFTAGSAAAAVAPSIDALIAARAIQGVGGAIVMPLTLTLLSAAVPAERRGMALGAWGGISGLGVALGPVIGGAIVQGISWQWIFWINVPFGLIALPLGFRFLRESYGPAKSLDLGGVALLTAGMFGIVFGLVRGNSAGWTSPEIVASLAAGVVLTAAVRGLGAACPRADAADGLLPQPGVQRGERILADDVLRDVRVDLPVDPVPPERAGLLGAQRRAAHPAVDGHADDRGTDRRRAVRPHRRAAAGRHRAGAPGDRPGVAGGGAASRRWPTARS